MIVQSVDAPIAADDRVLLAVGRKSAQKISGIDGRKRAALFISRKDAPAGLAAVVVDTPAAVQLPWLAAAFPGRRRVVVARQPGRADRIDDELIAAAVVAGLDLLLVDVARPGDAVAAVDAALARPGGKAIVLFIADDAVITADTIAPLMQAAFRARVPVVGFSAYFKKVGAVAVVDTDVAQMVDEALAMATASVDCVAPCIAPQVASASARLVVDGRLAERLGIPVQAAAHVEVVR